MTLYIIGIGMWDEKDITLKGLEAVKKSEHVYLEYYTCKLACSVEDLEKLYEKKIIVADRDMVEKKADEILDKAKDSDVSFLVIGDPFCATTHTDLRIRAKDRGVEVRMINNASILNSLGITGLDLYKFGRITSIPFANENVVSPLNVIKQNQEMGLATLTLFDLDPPNDKYMSINEALEYLLRIGLPEDTLCVGCAGVGSDEPQIKAKKASELVKEEFTLFPQCMIVPGNLHFIEEEALEKLCK